MKRNAYRFQEFADELRNTIDSPGAFEQFGLPDPDKEDIKLQNILQDTLMATELVAMLAKEVEFYVNGDINKETFLARYEEIERKVETDLAGKSG